MSKNYKNWELGYNFEVQLWCSEGDYDKVVALIGEPTKQKIYKNNIMCKWSDDLKTLCELIIPNKSKLDSLKIEPQLWLYYLYEEQCNLEFDSEQLKLISESGMCFCVTCLEE